MALGRTLYSLSLGFLIYKTELALASLGKGCVKAEGTCGPDLATSVVVGVVSSIPRTCSLPRTLGLLEGAQAGSAMRPLWAEPGRRLKKQARALASRLESGALWEGGCGQGW